MQSIIPRIHPSGVQVSPNIPCTSYPIKTRRVLRRQTTKNHAMYALCQASCDPSLVLLSTKENPALRFVACPAGHSISHLEGLVPVEASRFRPSKTQGRNAPSIFISVFIFLPTGSTRSTAKLHYSFTGAPTNPAPVSHVPSPACSVARLPCRNASTC
jgi:hypothetical protein